jgi:pimeloyl-ACP methyl ester carboxylesterase
MKLKANEIELYYGEKGKGSPMVFVHGWMEDHSMWNSQIRYFSENHRVIAYDQRGHGRSDKPKKGYSIKTLSDDLYNFTQKLNIKPFTLVGHSLGGMAAMEFALDHPEKVSKLVLVSTSAKTASSLRIPLQVLIHALPYGIFADGSVDFKYYKPSKQIKAEAVDRALRTPKYAACECLREFCTNYDIRDRVSNIKVPTLIIVGDKDTSTPVTLSRYLRREIEGSRLAIVPDSKHMPMIEREDMVNEVIDEFINGN